MTPKKEMEKQQIIDAWHNGYNNQSPMIDEENCGQTYYNETYGSKGTDAKDVVLGYKTSLDAQMLDSQLPQTTSDKWKEYQDWLNEFTELSNEEITKLANEHILYNDSKRQWIIEGMKLYREQLKQNMKVVKNLIGMALLIGFINPIAFTNHQQWYQGFVCLLASFIGSGLLYGFKGYAVNPKKIGNADEQPNINQVWMMFFIGAVANLLFATLYV